MEEKNTNTPIAPFKDHKTRVLLFLLIAFASLSLDLSTKWWAGSLFNNDNCPYPECSLAPLSTEGYCLSSSNDIYPVSEIRKEVIPDFFYIHLLNNTGAAWSFLSGNNKLFIAFNILFLLAAFFYMLTPKNLSLIILISFSLIIGGAMGNFYDRLVHGSVRDFLSFLIPYPGGVYPYPVFNVADISICVGAGLYLLDQIVLEKLRKKRTNELKLAVSENGT